MNELKKQDIYLPATIEELHEFILIGKEKIKLHKAKIKAIQNSNMAEEVLKIALEDGQDAGTAVIYAEAKLGEFLEKIPKQGDKYSYLGGTIPSFPEGIDKKFSHEAQSDNQFTASSLRVLAQIGVKKKESSAPTRGEPVCKVPFLDLPEITFRTPPRGKTSRRREDLSFSHHA